MDSVELIDKQVADHVIAISNSQDRRAIARRTVDSISARIGISSIPAITTIVSSPIEQPSFSPAERSALLDLVEERDQAAWRAQEAGGEVLYGQLFCQARAANAVLNFAEESPDGNLSDVLYEAYIAADNDLDFIRQMLDI